MIQAGNTYRKQSIIYYKKLLRAIRNLKIDYLIPKLEYNLRNAFEINRFALSTAHLNPSYTNDAIEISNTTNQHTNTPHPFSFVFDNSYTQFYNYKNVVTKQLPIKNKADLENYFLQSSSLTLNYIESLSDLDSKVIETIFRSNL
ncbi:hypothetical protein BB561_002789 [Smittium simulii]|uniref:Uncharacterized protein n=1 Tax=Smittium simulii TaxID=133385 RepID=A0A2T9YP53_9FUNG|nr:hypothetical protein BB561_002789 [Smittium simulii]